jgi:hypothetical protein
MRIRRGPQKADDPPVPLTNTTTLSGLICGGCIERKAVESAT